MKRDTDQHCHVWLAPSLLVYPNLITPSSMVSAMFWSGHCSLEPLHHLKRHRCKHCIASKTLRRTFGSCDGWGSPRRAIPPLWLLQVPSRLSTNGSHSDGIRFPKWRQTVPWNWFLVASSMADCAFAPVPLWRPMVNRCKPCLTECGSGLSLKLSQLTQQAPL